MSRMTDSVCGTAVYLRRTFESSSSIAKRCKAMGLGWAAVGAIWQERDATKFLNIPSRCREISRALRDVDVVPYVWGYPWLGSEQAFIDGMVECAGDEGLYLLDPELGMNPTRNPHAMDVPNASAARIVSDLRSRGAKKIGLSTFGNEPSWFPLRAFLRSGVDFAGGQTYTDDKAVDVSIAEFLSELKVCGSTAQLVPNFGIYARAADGSARSKTPAELRAHLDEFINEGEPVRAMIGWADNFLTPALEHEIALFSARLSGRS